MVKVTVLYGHPESTMAFEEYYRETHMPLAAKIPHVVKAEFTKFIGTPEGSFPSQYRMAEVYFDDMEDLKAGLNSKEGEDNVADLSKFATGGADVQVGEI